MANRGTALSCALIALTLLLSALITGCGIGTPASPSAPALQGHVTGANLPVQNGRVYLFAANTTGYGAASKTLLLHDDLHPAVYIDSDGLNGSNVTDSNTYVLTDSNGDFDVTGDYTCPSSTTEVYVLIAGGNPGISAGTDNPALALMATLGSCSNFNAGIYTLQPSFVSINEVTTVASVYALAQFMVDATHVGTSSTNLTGLANAFNTVGNLVTNATGSANSTSTLTGAGVSRTVTAPQTELNSLANALVLCVNSDGGSDSQCGSLFAAAGNSSYTDTVQAMLGIAKAPAANVDAVWQRTPAQDFFTPSLDSTTGEPADWSVSLTYAGGNNDGEEMALDANGAMWSITSNGSGENLIVGMSNNGTPLTPSTGIYNAGSLDIGSLAFDTNGKLWFDESDYNGDGISDVKQIDTGSGSVLHTASGNGTGLNSTDSDAETLIVDGNNNVWMWMASPTFDNNGSVDMLSSTNGYTAPAGFPSTNGGFNNDYDLVVDTSNNLWAGGQISSGIAAIAYNGASVAGAPFATSILTRSLGIDKFSRICFSAVDPDNTDTDIYRMDQDGTLGTAALVPQFSADGVMVDGGDNAWVVTTSGSGAQLTEVNDSGTIVQSFGASSSTLEVNFQAIDSSGNIWVVSFNNSTQAYSIGQYVGAAVPVQTPTSAQISANKIGQLP